MQTENTLTIRGPLDRIYAYAAEVERWPEILPHYREVEILEPGERLRLVRMFCVRDFGPIHWPCKWRARQELLPAEGRILYDHVAGPTRGMQVEWKLVEGPDGVRTTIWHELKPRIPLIGGIYTNGIIGPLFVHAIAGRTLETIKRLVEGEVAA